MKINLFLIGIAFCMGCAAQGKNFVITGEMTRDSLRFTRQAITQLTLNHIVDGQEEVLATAKVTGKKFRFEGVAPEYVEAAFISGFDNGNVQLLLEEGHITVAPFDAHFPVSAQIGGTPNNEVWNTYQSLRSKSGEDAKRKMEEQMAQLPDKLKEDRDAFLPYQSAIFHSGSFYYKLDVMELFRKYVNMPAALFMIKYDLYYFLTPKAVERQLLRALPVELHSHPLYTELANQIKSSNLKEGAPAPDIAGLTPEGKPLKLSDLNGKYVLLDVWASWCGPCRREFPFIKQALEASEASDKFVVLSYSIDDKKNEWLNSIEKNALTHKNWLHISTLKGWKSDAVQLFNVKGVPYTVLLNPKGEVVAFNLRGEEMVKKIKGIIDGTVKYE